MPPFDLDPVEREALAFIIRDLEAGHTHVCTDAFLPFLKSIEAGGRLLPILKHFEGLGIVTPEYPSGNKWPGAPLVGRIMPAYWRIEGKAMCLYRELFRREPGKNLRVKEGKRGRGRPADTDAKADQKIVDAWTTKEYKTYADLARELSKRENEVRKAIDRHRHRTTRRSVNRRTNSPDA